MIILLKHNISIIINTNIKLFFLMKNMECQGRFPAKQQNGVKEP